jgi:hypothetical protein
LRYAVGGWADRQCYECRQPVDIRDYFRYVYLCRTIDDFVPEASGGDQVYIRQGSPVIGDYTGYVDKHNRGLTTFYAAGLLDLNKSYSNAKETKLVYEWSESYGNGVFDTVVHTGSTSLTDNFQSYSSSSLRGLYWKEEPSIDVGLKGRPIDNGSRFCVTRMPDGDGMKDIYYTSWFIEGEDLTCKRNDLTTGDQEKIIMTAWNSQFGGSIPHGIAMYETATQRYFAFINPTYTSSPVLYKLDLVDGVWVHEKRVLAHNAQNGISFSDDGEHVYGVLGWPSTHVHKHQVSNGANIGSVAISNVWATVHNGYIWQRYRLFGNIKW